MNRILIVEDDPVLAETLKYHLTLQGYQAETALSLTEAEKAGADAAVAGMPWHLVILDVNLPEGDSFSLCRRWKEETPDTAVIFLTARDLENDMLQGFAQGADDYITKPFPVSVLKKKIERILQRSAAGEKQSRIYSDDRFRVDFDRMDAQLDGNPVALTALEIKLIGVLTARQHAVVTRRTLLETLWDAEENFVDEHALTSAVSRIRNKLEYSGYEAVRTIYGMGYMWVGGTRK